MIAVVSILQEQFLKPKESMIFGASAERSQREDPTERALALGCIGRGLCGLFF